MSKTQIVVGYDFSDSAGIALERAIEIACRDPGNVYLHLVTAMERHQSYETAEEIRQDLLDRLHAVFATRRPGVDVELFVHVRLGKAAEEVLGVAKEVGADLILVGSHGRGAVKRAILGSVSQQVLHQAHCPVLVARLKTYPTVELEKVVESHSTGPHRELAHRYSYTSNRLQTRPPEWPIP